MGIRTTLLGTGCTAAALAAALVGGLLTPVTAAPRDFTDMQASVQPVDRPDPTVLPLPAVPSANPDADADPGRPLQQDTAERAVSAAEAALPTGWSPGRKPPDGDPRTDPLACDELFEHNAAAENTMRSRDWLVTVNAVIT